MRNLEKKPPPPPPPVTGRSCVRGVRCEGCDAVAGEPSPSFMSRCNCCSTGTSSVKDGREAGFLCQHLCITSASMAGVPAGIGGRSPCCTTPTAACKLIFLISTTSRHLRAHAPSCWHSHVLQPRRGSIHDTNYYYTESLSSAHAQGDDMRWPTCAQPAGNGWGGQKGSDDAALCRRE